MSLTGTSSQFDASVGGRKAPGAFAAVEPCRHDTGVASGELAWHLVKTHKGRPLRFRGERIIRMTSEAADVDDQKHEIDLFMTEEDRFIVVVNRLDEDGTRHPITVFSAASAEEIRAHVAKLDPLSGLRVPLEIIENKSVGELLKAHETLARRMQATRRNLDALCEMALAPLC